MKVRIQLIAIICLGLLVSAGIFMAQKRVSTRPTPPRLGGTNSGGVTPSSPSTEPASQPVANQLPPAPQDPLIGFYGPYGLKQVEGNAVVVLAPALTVTSTGSWQAWGLVRNESPREVGPVTVTAVLFAQDGTLLAKPTGRVPLDSLRPGEPGPFTVSATVEAARVARVEWKISAGEPTGRLLRDLGPTEERIMLFGVAEYKGIKRPGPPYPYVLNLEFINKGAPLQDVRDVKVTMAWLDQEQRVVWVAGSSLQDGLSHSYQTGYGAPFAPIVIRDEAIAARLAYTRLMYWLYAYPR